MNIQLLDKTMTTAPVLQATRKRDDILLFIVIFFTVLSLTPLLVLSGITIGIGLLLGGTLALIVSILLVRWPILGFFVVMICATLVEQDAITPAPPLTDHLYVFYWPPRLEGLPERPIGFFILFIFFVLICQRLAKRQGLIKGGPLFLPFFAYMLCVAIGIIHGLTSGGDFRIIVLEIRPFWYLFVSYLLAYNLVTHKKHVRALLWILILCAAIKGLQGTYIYLIVLKGSLVGHHEIMAHEESFFFIAVLLLIVLFCTHYRYRPQLYAALAVMPFILIALIGNQRRADYMALLMGILVSCALLFVAKPHIRKKLVTGLIICLIIGAAYTAIFYKSSGAFAQPARAIVSVFYPDPTSEDYLSNLYRIVENNDLKYTLKQSPLVGWGFGKPFLQPQLLPNIISLDPYYLYIPHNTIYWVWMRLGALGFLVFWCLIGSIIVRGCLIARQLKDAYLQLVAIFIVAVTVMEIILAYADYQLYFYRNIIYLGLLVGVLVKLPALDAQKEQYTHEAANGVGLPTTSIVGSRSTQLLPVKSCGPSA